jgi:sugar phosphate isomerase/epimerase
LDPEESVIASLRAKGVTALEPGAVFLTRHDKAAIEAVGEWCRASGIKVYACHAPFGGPDDISLPDEDDRQQAVASIEDSLVRAALAGAECVVIHPSGSGLEAAERATRLAQLIRSLEALIPSAERAGVNLALENMLPRHLGDHSAEMMGIVQHFDSPRLGICFDVGHAHLNPEGVLGAFEVLYDRIITFHLQDNDGNRDRHLQPPYGTIDWAQFVRLCRPDDFTFPWSVETAPWNGVGWDVMLREMRALFLRGLLTVPWQGEQMRAICDRCGRYCFGTVDDWFCGCGEGRA